MPNNVTEIFLIVFSVETANRCSQKLYLKKNAKKPFGKKFNLDIIPQIVYTIK